MKRKNISHLLGFIMLAFLFSCSNAHKITTTEIYDSPQEMVAAADAVVENVTLNELKEELQEKENLYLIDVRTAGEFEEGSIPGAISVPRGVLEFVMFNDEFWEEKNRNPPSKTDEVILYCRSGNRSVLSAVSLMQLGFIHVKSFGGGWNAWSDENQQ